ncbi:HlyD family type I secretion periplasmic adaptor subunit [Salinarimonas rosea]|uniref:HlyD family type I secretion periplasmic adaptor subunit n=1 Tax=Salinarimonas rosea TaxID=552063 RepID=UPI00040721D2|nr:HlyD family type I secretion periplasmic adaptor subunit [Salinarimonas rosea]
MSERVPPSENDDEKRPIGAAEPTPFPGVRTAAAHAAAAAKDRTDEGEPSAATPPAPAERGPRTGYRGAMITGAVAFVALFGGVGAYLAHAEIAGAVVAPGTVALEGRPRSVQHLDGGVVDEILAAEGDLVARGAVLVRLDDTALAANLAIYENRWREAIARQARLEAERDGAREVRPLAGPDSVVAVLPRDAHLLAQVSLFEARRAAREGQIQQAREKIEQLANQRRGVEGLVASLAEQISSYDDEIGGLRDLVEKGFAQRTRLLAMERERSDLVGARTREEAELARIDNAKAETEIAVLQIEREFKEAVLSELRDVSLEASELAQQIVATRKQLERIEIRAPVAGVVHELALNTIGGVVAPGATVAQIISREDGLEIEASVEPMAIDRVAVDQSSFIRFSAFNARTTPELVGRVSRISANSVVDEATGASFYRVVVRLEAEELARLEGRVLVPGMPADVFITTEQRSILSYLFKPVTDHLEQALRER